MRSWAMTCGAIGVAISILSTHLASAQELKPPPPMPTEGSPSGEPQPTGTPANPGKEATTEEQLANAEKEDSGRNFEIFWIRAEGGGSYLNLQQFSASSFSLQNTSGGGGMFGLATGVRFFIFTLGPRFRYHALSDFSFGQLNGELGLHFGSGSLDPFFSLHGGYSFVSTGNLAASASDVSVRGFNAGLSAGFDYYLSPLFTLGFGLTGEALFLKRPPVALPAQFSALPAAEQAKVKNDPLYANSGSSAGFGITGAITAGLHFGL